MQKTNVYKLNSVCYQVKKREIILRKNDFLIKAFQSLFLSGTSRNNTFEDKLTDYDKQN